MKLVRWLLPLLFVLLLAAPAWAATYFVDPVSGDDSHAGTAFATAFKSIDKARSVVGAGDTVKLCATGTESLSGTATIAFTAAGTNSPAGRIQYIGYDATGTNPLTGANYYTIDGSGMTAGNDMWSFNAVAFTNFTHIKLTGAKRYAINIVSTDTARSVVFDHVFFTGAGTALINSGNYQSPFHMENCTFSSCAYGFKGNANSCSPSFDACLFDTLSTAAITGTPQILPVMNCVFTTCGIGIDGSYGSQTTLAASPMFLNHNTFYKCTTGILVMSSNATTGLAGVITANTFTAPTSGTSYGIRAYNNNSTIGSLLTNYNHFYNSGNGSFSNYTGGLLVGPDDVSGDPLFNAAGSNDFRVKPGSPLIGVGPLSENIGAMGQVPGGSGSYPILSSVIVRAKP